MKRAWIQSRDQTKDWPQYPSSASLTRHNDRILVSFARHLTPNHRPLLASRFLYWNSIESYLISDTDALELIKINHC